MSADADDRLGIEPLDPARHDRAGFSCGVAKLDNFIRRTARKQADADITNLFVLTDDGRRILGYFTLNAHSIHREDMGSAAPRSGPDDRPIPVAFLGFLAIATELQGEGLGEELLFAALERALAASERIALQSVVLDVLDDGDSAARERRKRFYERHGFTAFASDPWRMYLPMATVREIFHRAG